MNRLLHRRVARTLALAAAIVLGSTAAWAYWVAPSSGSGGGHVATLATPSISSATPGNGTVALTWGAVAAPGAGSVSYYVRRDGGAPAGNCPAAASPATQTSCTDGGLAAGTHKYTVTAVFRSWSARSAETSATVTVGAVDHLVLSAASTSPTAGAADNLTITAKDSSGATVTAYSGAKSLTFGGASTIGSRKPTVTNSSGSAVAFGTAETINFTNGVATTSSGRNGTMTLYKAETASITVSDGTVSNGTGTSVTVSPASTNALTLSTPSPAAGTPFSETLNAVDQYGNATPSYTGSRNLTFEGPSKSPSSKSPSYPGSVTFTAGTGTATITLYDAQSTTLSAREGSSGPSGTSASFTVTPAPVAGFTLATPGTQTAGTGFGETITAKDAYGNTASAYEGAKTIAFSGPASSPSGKAPEYPASVTFTGGSGTATVTLYDAGTTTLAASDGTSSGTSASFAVTGASASGFALSTPTPTAGTSFSETVTAQDSYGNPAGNYSGTKTVAFSGPASSPNGKSPSYPSTLSFSGSTASGTATITLYDVQTTTLTATQGALTGTTASFSVIPGTATTFAFGAIGAQAAGTPFSVTLTATDAGGNPVADGARAITFKGPAESPSGKAPEYPASVTFAGGSGTASVALYGAGSTTLSAELGAAKGTSASFAVNPLAASRLAWTSFSGNGSAEGLCLFTCTWSGLGANKKWSTKVSVTDVYGNVVSGLGAGHTVTLEKTLSGATLSPTTLTIASSGEATSTAATTYTSPGGGWTSDTLTAKSSPYTEATATLKK